MELSMAGHVRGKLIRQKITSSCSVTRRRHRRKQQNEPAERDAKFVFVDAGEKGRAADYLTREKG